MVYCLISEWCDAASFCQRPASHAFLFFAMLIRYHQLGLGFFSKSSKKLVAAVSAVPRISPLADIQAKLQAGKGIGYANRAKTFNLKQMAQILMYLFNHVGGYPFPSTY